MFSELHRAELGNNHEEEDDFDFSDTDEGVVRNRPNTHEEVAQVMNSVMQSQYSGVCSQQESEFSSLKTNHIQATAFQSSQNFDTLVNPKSSAGNFNSIGRLGSGAPRNLKHNKAQPGLPRGRRNTEQQSVQNTFLTNNKENLAANTHNVSGMNQTLSTQLSNHFEKTYEKMVKQKVLVNTSRLRQSSRTASHHDVRQFTERMNQQEQQRVAKIETLKQMNSSKDLAGCTFRPQTSQTRKKSISRPPQQFVQDQQKREEQRQRMLLELAEQQNEQQQSILNPQPQINKKSLQILEKTKTPRMPVHERLNNKERSLSALGQRKKSQVRDYSASFKPSIHKKSQNLRRPQPVSDILYQDAKLRKQRHQERSQIRLAQELEATQQQIQKLPGSEKYVIQKFTKELVQLWQNMQIDENNQENETMNYIILKDFLQKTGFFAGEKGSKGIQLEEHEMFIEIWKQLGGKERSLVTLNNLRIFLFAIMGIFIEPNLNRNEQKLSPILESFGTLNEHGDLFLGLNDVPQIQKNFHKLYLNRMQFENLRQQQKRSQKQGQVDFTFKPMINEVSRVIAKNYQSKIHNESIQNSTFDRLANPKDHEAWREEAQKILIEEEMRNCTFKPETNIGLTDRSRQANLKKQLPPKSKQQKLRIDETKFENISEITNNHRQLECNTSLGIRTEENELEQIVQRPYTSSKASKATPSSKIQKQTDIFKQGLQQLSQEIKYEAPEKLKRQEKLEIQEKLEKPASKVSFQTANEGRPSQLEFPTEQKTKIEGFISNEQPCIQLHETEMDEMTEADQEQQYFMYANQALLDESQQTQNSCSLKEQFPFQKEETRLADLQKYKQSSAGNTPLPEANQPSFNRYNMKEEEEEEVLDETSSFKNFSEDETFPVQKKVQVLEDSEAEERMPLIFVDVNLGPARQERIIIYEGDQAQELASHFCYKHGLSEDTEERLVELLQMQIEKANQK